jgi:hypothetical protein
MRDPQRYLLIRYRFDNYAGVYIERALEHYGTRAEAERAYRSAIENGDGCTPDLIDNLTGDYLK